MKRLSQIISIILICITGIILIASVGSSIMKTPFLLTVIRSNSMYPLVERGDMVLLQPLSDNQSKEIGDVIIFKSEEGRLASQGWVFHRIVDGNEEGFITQGDANERTDQADGAVTVKSEEIVGKSVVLGENVLKVPLVGYLSLGLENFQNNSFSLPIMALMLTVIIAISEFFPTKKKKSRKKTHKNYLELPLLYFLSGLTITIMMAATMLTAGQHISVPYEVSQDGRGVLMGSDVGIIPVGDVIEKNLVDLNSNGSFPMIASITTNDPQISFNHDHLTTVKGQDTKITMTLEATTPGKYNSTIHVGMFMPLLPRNIIHSLCKINYWFALGVVSLIPGIPLMVYPLLDRSLRRKTRKGFRQVCRNIRRSLPI